MKYYDKDSIQKVFEYKRYRKLQDADLYRDSPSTDQIKLDEFIQRLGIIGIVAFPSHMMFHFSDYLGVLDHAQIVKTNRGENLIISFPYADLKLAKDMADRFCEEYGLCAYLAPEYSWYQKGETIPIIFARARADYDCPRTRALTGGMSE